ncbi:MAG: glycosyltransferase family 4 protein [Nitrospira sp.]|jgi:glycosyltransferase involved in cell wall biosynthesis|nr:glycosyltransferase family 4 protein [Nitrospira sp.]
MIRLAFIGPMVGAKCEVVSTQGDIVAKLFAKAGYSVVAASAKPNRYMRLVDIASTLVRKRKGIDLQCVQVYSGPSFILADLASWLGKLFGHSLVLFLHGGSLPNFMVRYPNWTQRVFNRADRLVAPSDFLANAFVQYGYKIEVIPNVIDLSVYPFRHRKSLTPRLLWMRAFHQVYNPLMAIHVLVRVRAVMPTATLVMAGLDKGMQDDAQALASKEGVSDAVRFPGFLDMAAKGREGNHADIFLNTSHVDNMPVSVVEACAMGLPVVSTAVGGVPALLGDGETGLLVPDNDVHAMSNAVLRLCIDSTLAEKLSANGRRLAESSSWTMVRAKWERMFTQISVTSGSRER